jgi:Na+/H+ antiporter NhaD/arsenite permease-like protein
VRDLLLLLCAGISWVITPLETREANEFSWFPIQEVAKLFAGIFVTIIPAIAILKAGEQGALAPVVSAVTLPDGTPNNAMYFWATGILSSFLDNAPTYLVFFNTAGGDPVELTGPLATTLLAISAGAVFMGANTYIGNAPNFMVRAIAEERGTPMPSFFGYMLWSGGFLLPLFVLVTLIWFL